MLPGSIPRDLRSQKSYIFNPNPNPNPSGLSGCMPKLRSSASSGGIRSSSWTSCSPWMSRRSSTSTPIRHVHHPNPHPNPILTLTLTLPRPLSRACPLPEPTLPATARMRILYLLLPQHCRTDSTHLCPLITTKHLTPTSKTLTLTNQVVKADIKELWDMSLDGAPLAMVPMGDSRKETLTLAPAKYP